MKRKKSKKQAVLNFKFSDLFSSDYRIITALLVIFPLLIYLQVYDFEFVWDEVSKPINHLNNPFVEYSSWASFTQLFTQPFFGMYIPTSYLLWGLLKSIAELLSLPANSILHLSNVVVHIINGLLVFTILKQFVVNKWAVLIGVGFFLLHPIQVEVVAFVSEFRSVLAALFALLSCYYYLKNQAKLSYLSLIFFVLAVLSKPSAVVLVPFVFLLNYFHYGFKLGKNIEKILPFALIALVFVLITGSAQFSANTNFAQYTLDFWQRPFAWLDSIVFYLYKIIYPYHLSASYTLSPKFISVQWWFYPLALVPFALGCLLWLRRKTQPLLVFAAALFIAGFFTTSGFVDFFFQKYSLVTDRYIYLAMIGTALAVSGMADKKYWRVGLLSVLLIFTLLSAFRQIPVWQNKFTLWSNSVSYEVTPQYAHLNLAVYFYNQGNIFYNANKYKQAIQHFDKAIKLFPKKHTGKLAKAFYNKGISLLVLKQHQQASIALGRSVQIDTSNSQAHNANIDALIIIKQCKKAKQAAVFAQQHKIKLQQAIAKNLHKVCP